MDQQTRCNHSRIVLRSLQLIHRGQDMLSTAITIDSGEKDSSTAATPSVVGSYGGVSTADVIRIDVDVVATNTLGLEIRMVFNT